MACSETRADAGDFLLDDAPRHHGVAEQQEDDLQNILREPEVDWEAVRRYLFLEGVNPNVANYDTWVGTMHLAASAGETEVVRWCLSMGANPNERTKLGRSPLHYATEKDRTGCVRMLLEHDADPNLCSLSGLTPLHLAARSGSYGSLLVLVESKIVLDLDAEDQHRQTPEQMANTKEIRRVLRRYRTTIDAKKKTELVEYSVRRLFTLFDRRGDQTIHPEEWVECQALLAETFEEYNGDGVDDAFELADANHDGRIDWEEFLSSHATMLEAVKLSHQEVIRRISDLELQLWQKSVDQKDLCDSPQARQIARRRSQVQNS